MRPALTPTSDPPPVSFRVSAASALRRRPIRLWTFLIIWLVFWAAVEITVSRTHMYSWHYVMSGSAAIRSPSWFKLYGLHPELQMGPLTFVIAQPFLLLPAQVGRAAAAGAMAGVGLLVVREIRALVPPATPHEARRWLVLSGVFLVGWLEVAVRFGHLDDVMTLLCGVAAMRAARGQRFVLAAITVGLAVDFKPWAAPFAMLLLAPPLNRRRAFAIVALIAVVAAAWVPFVALDPAILRVTQFVIRVDPASTLRLLALAGGSTPAWCRPAQFALGALLAVFAVRTRRWQSVVLVVIAARLLLDPATQPYYDSGLLLATVLFDLATAHAAIRRWPAITTLAAVLLVYLPSYLLVDLPEARGVLRTIGLVGLVALALCVPRLRDRPS